MPFQRIGAFDERFRYWGFPLTGHFGVILKDLVCDGVYQHPAALPGHADANVPAQHVCIEHNKFLELMGPMLKVGAAVGAGVPAVGFSLTNAGVIALNAAVGANVVPAAHTPGQPTFAEVQDAIRGVLQGGFELLAAHLLAPTTGAGTAQLDLINLASTPFAIAAQLTTNIYPDAHMAQRNDLVPAAIGILSGALAASPYANTNITNQPMLIVSGAPHIFDFDDTPSAVKAGDSTVFPASLDDFNVRMGRNAKFAEESSAAFKNAMKLFVESEKAICPNVALICGTESDTVVAEQMDKLMHLFGLKADRNISSSLQQLEMKITGKNFQYLIPAAGAGGMAMPLATTVEAFFRAYQKYEDTGGGNGAAESASGAKGDTFTQNALVRKLASAETKAALDRVDGAGMDLKQVCRIVIQTQLPPLQAAFYTDFSKLNPVLGRIFEAKGYIMNVVAEQLIANTIFNGIEGLDQSLALSLKTKLETFMSGEELFRCKTWNGETMASFLLNIGNHLLAICVNRSFNTLADLLDEHPLFQMATKCFTQVAAIFGIHVKDFDDYKAKVDQAVQLLGFHSDYGRNLRFKAVSLDFAATTADLANMVNFKRSNHAITADENTFGAQGEHIIYLHC